MVPSLSATEHRLLIQFVCVRALVRLLCEANGLDVIVPNIRYVMTKKCAMHEFRRRIQIDFRISSFAMDFLRIH